MELDVERRINVTWVSDSQMVRPISITVITDDREGMLTDLSAVFARMSINISEAKCRGLGDGQAINTFKCGVVDLEQVKTRHAQAWFPKGSAPCGKNPK